ncbi:hypothetical protein OVV86_26605, partial [Klebsiella pneumoniae]|uniref:hypothetical protein n=1 Tax=Klebsiella pneumoniae TaxID=573 RepID=UPI00226FC86F
ARMIILLTMKPRGVTGPHPDIKRARRQVTHHHPRSLSARLYEKQMSDKFPGSARYPKNWVTTGDPAAGPSTAEACMQAWRNHARGW